MKFIRDMKFAFVALVVACATISCITEEAVPTVERERVSLEAWMKLNKSHLLGNYQANGGYYVEILEDNNDGVEASGNSCGSDPIMDQETCWVYMDMTGRDINGAICLTRNYQLAQLCGSFANQTHYVPYVCYGGSTNYGLLEGTYLAMRTEFVLSEEYRAWHLNERKFALESTYKLHKGSKVRLYLPSTIAYGESGSMAEGGYEGQYSLDASRPLIVDIDVKSVIKNPSDLELEMLRLYVGDNESWKVATKPESEKVDANDDLKLTGLYYNLGYNPDTDDARGYKYLQPDCMDMADKLNKPYTDNRKYAPGEMAKLNDTINKILLKRFGKGLSADKMTDATQVTKNGRAKVWYVLRFLDGFVVDTNIAEIRTIVFDESAPECSVFSYSPSDDEGKDSSSRQAIGAWYYGIPSMHYGAYGQILTTSGYAYGAGGMSGSTTTQTTTTGTASYYDAMNYYNYYNSYYNYYSPYYNYYDYNYYTYDTSGTETVTTTTISTEILPYTPLIFTLYVEPN